MSKITKVIIKLISNGNTNNNNSNSNKKFQ